MIMQYLRSHAMADAEASRSSPRLCVENSGLADGYQHLAAFDLDLVSLHARVGIIWRLPVTHIVCPTVPRARDDAAIQLALGEGPALMFADVVDGMELPAPDVEHRHLSPLQLEHLALPDRDLARARHPDEFRHVALPPSPRAARRA